MQFQPLIEELLTLWENENALNLKNFTTSLLQIPVHELIAYANAVRHQLEPERKVGYLVERNINYTNVCSIRCAFCTFSRSLKSPDAYVLGFDEIGKKVEELVQQKGDQILLQGGVHPLLPLSWYVDLLSFLKSRFPQLKIHAFSPHEIAHMAKMSKKSIAEVLQILMKAGLDYLPGAGAEILVDRVRKIISPAKLSSDEWLEVMRIAHQLGIPTSATMMYGHIETWEERIAHLRKIYVLQREKPLDSPGFVAFIAWPYMSGNDRMQKLLFVSPHTPVTYLKIVALARILLQNIFIIQASWLTVGEETAIMALHAGANDMGSIMIEENVITGGINSTFPSEEKMQRLIKKAGFTPYRR